MNKVSIKIGEKEYTAKLGLAFLELVTKSEEITLADIFNKFENETFFFLPKLIYYAIKNGGADIELSDIYDWLDLEGLQNEQVVNFATKFGESVKVHVPQDEKVGKPKAKAKTS